MALSDPQSPTGVITVSTPRFPTPNRLEFDVRHPTSGDVTVWFEASIPVDRSSAAILPTVLPTAMRANSRLSLPGSQDPWALENAARAQKLLNSWFGNLARIDVSASADENDRRPADGVGCFFSGGVDSFYSAIDRINEITHLIFVHGFDIDIEDESLGAQAISEAHQAATALGKELIVVRTNVRKMSDLHVSWGREYHGAALAAVAHLMRAQLGHVFIPASYHVTELFPWGSHPDLDPLWSSTSLKLIHHGEDKTRPEKVAAIAFNPAAMDHLRVCWENRGGRFNCGECEKCVRTMINLRSAGALDRCRTLPHVIDASELKRIRSGHGPSVFAKENLRALAASGISDPELERALRSIIRRAPISDALRGLKRHIRKFSKPWRLQRTS